LTITSGESRRADLPYRLCVRTIGVLFGSLVIVATATASTLVDVTVLPKPGFPRPGTDVSPKDRRLLDRRSGKVLDRLAVPSAPEIIKLRGDRLHVRTYDRQLVARIAGS
jgi:hypothetical protein